MNHELGKQMPQSIEEEALVLGTVLLYPELGLQAVDILNEDVFYPDNHKVIFRAIKKIITDKTPLDIISLCSELKKMNMLDYVGGAYYISQLSNRATTDTNFEYHCRILQQISFKRTAIKIGHKLTSEGYDDFIDVFDLIDGAVRDLRNIEKNIIPNTIVSNETIIDNVIENIKNAQSKGGIIGASTGIANLDHALMGLRFGLKYVFAARPGVGKTSLAKSICINMANVQNMPGCFFSLEMSREQLMMACISEILQLDNTKIQKGQLTDIDIQNINNLKNGLFSKNFIIDATGGLSPKQMRTKIRMMVEKYKIQWIAVDYLGLMELKEDAKGKSDESILSTITADLKNIAKEFNLIVIELCQLSREVEKRKSAMPVLSDLKGSGAIEANADVVIFIYRPEYHGIHSINGENSHGFAEAIIAKNRFGPVINIAMKYIHRFTQFKNHETAVELEHSEDIHTDNQPSF